jgi:hypothetical protein
MRNNLGLRDREALRLEQNRAKYWEDREDKKEEGRKKGEERRKEKNIQIWLLPLPSSL